MVLSGDGRLILRGRGLIGTQGKGYSRSCRYRDCLKKS